MDFVESFVRIWRLCNGNMTLTGAYVKDLQRYPGFWEHDFVICLSEIQRAESIADNTVKKPNGRQSRG